MGETITVSRRNRTDVEIEITFRPLGGMNGNGDRPRGPAGRPDRRPGHRPERQPGRRHQPHHQGGGPVRPARLAPAGRRATSSGTPCATSRPTPTRGCAAPAPTRPSRSPTGWRARGTTCGSTRTRFSCTCADPGAAATPRARPAPLDGRRRRCGAGPRRVVCRWSVGVCGGGLGGRRFARSAPPRRRSGAQQAPESALHLCHHLAEVAQRVRRLGRAGDLLEQ